MNSFARARRIAYLCILIAITSEAFAVKTYRNSNDFKFIKLKGNLKDRANALFTGKTHFKSDEIVHDSIKSFKSGDQDIIFTGKGIINASARNPKDELNPLYQQIISYLTPRYESIGDTNASSVLKYNNDFNLGVQNYSGFQWQKPMGTVTIGVDRQIAPDFQDDNVWITRDYFYMSINAHTYFSNLRDNTEFEMTDETLAAFAGIQFTRVYSYTHLSDTYEKALTSNYEKLFMMFLYFRGKDFDKLDDYDIVTKTDYFSFNAGGVIVLPISQGLGANAGALVKLKRMSQVSIQKLGALDEPRLNEQVRINFEKEEGKSVEVNVELLADLFNFLRVTLLSYEYTYEYDQSQSIMLSLYQEDLIEFKNESPFALEIFELLRLNKPKEELISHRIVSREQRIKEMKKSKYVALLLAGVHKRLSEFISIQRDHISKVFFKHSVENIKFVRSLWGNIFNKIIAKIIKLEPFNSYKYSRSRSNHLEYEAQRDLLKDKEVMINSKGKLSFKIKHKTYHTKIRGFFNKKYKKYLLSYIKNFTTFHPKVYSAIKKDKLRGPINVISNIEIHTNGLAYLNNNFAQTLGIIKDICKKHKRNKRRSCQKKLSKAFNNYRDSSTIYDTHMWNLKEFVWQFTKYMNSLSDLDNIFGKDNIFVHGSLAAKSKKGRSQLFYFKRGEFKNLGIIDEFSIH